MNKMFFQASISMKKSIYFIMLESKDEEKDFGYILINHCLNLNITAE